MRRPKIGNLVANTLVLLVSFIVVFVVCEIAARALYGDSTDLTPRYHTSADYGGIKLRTTRPNMVFSHTTADGTWQFTTNAQGFRNFADFTYEKPPGRLRVVTLGDSHTQGHECRQEATYSAVIDRYLTARGFDVEVMNTGVSGFSNAEELVLLEREMVRYSPDFVVVGFFANDFEDNLKAGLYRLSEEGELTLVKQQHVPGVRIQDLIYSLPGIQWLGEHSYFYSVLFNTTWKFFKTRLAASARRSIPDEMAVPTKARFTDYEIQLAAALIRQMHEVSRHAGAELIVLDIPQGDVNVAEPSITPELLLALDGHVDHLVASSIFDRYQGGAPIHMPHGGHHITEFVHTLLGIEAAEYIARRLETLPRP